MTVKLRTKKLSDGRISYFLLFYNRVDRQRRKEYLSLYTFIKPKDGLEKNHNKETKALAEKIHAKQLLETQDGRFGFDSKRKIEIPFLAYFESLVEKRKSSNKNFATWKGTSILLNKFTREEIKDDIYVSKIDSEYVSRFRKYLLDQYQKKSGSRLAQNSCNSYFNIFRASVREAFHTKLIKENPLLHAQSIKAAETKREFLTEEEIQRLFSTECQMARIKNAFLFGVLTGLRFSDITNLVWSDLQYSDANGWFIRFTQQKTRANETLHINAQARQLLGTPKEPVERIFKGLKYSAHTNTLIERWVHKAGINKHITFHSSRHTHACLLLSKGVDIYTVSKMLGHKHITTTQIYAKVIDQNKIKALQSIPSFTVLE